MSLLKALICKVHICEEHITLTKKMLLQMQVLLWLASSLRPEFAEGEEAEAAIG